MAQVLADLWNTSRSGSHAGRGFRYQDTVAAHLAIQAWGGNLPIQSLVPEGLEDISLRLRNRDIHVQVKSRREHRGDFSLSDVVSFLVEAWEKHERRLPAQPGAEMALVLERDMAGLPATGWESVIIDHPTLLTKLEQPILDAFIDNERARALVNTTHIVLLPSPREPDIATIANRIKLPRQGCLPHYQALYHLLGELSDANGSRDFADRAELSVNDVQRLFDEVTETIDVRALESAIRLGICEVVDFLTPLEDEDFYSGVDVVPGHVVADLTFNRPELIDDVLSGLFRRRVALIVGPSGSGKSAALWMSAYQTRFPVRWYRIKRLNDVDIEHVLRLMRAVRPTPRSPVGFVADDLGQAGREGWDLLVAEATQRPGVLLLGAAREEDLIQISTAHSSHIVRPSLDQQLAERIWQELILEGRTGWGDWHEPFEQSHSLLLEYTHLLTVGSRLEDTIKQQVDRRLIEARDLELRILRLVSVADTWGASLDANSINWLTGSTEEDLQRALRRLLDEHLIHRDSSGNLGGLHQIRSRYIAKASHMVPPPTQTETIGQVISIVNPADLQRFLAGILIENVFSDNLLFERLTLRLARDPDPELLIATLQALRLVSFMRIAENWLEILELNAVPPSNKILTAWLALAAVPTERLDLLAPSIRAAVPLLSATLENDLRKVLLDELSEDLLADIFGRVDSLSTANKLLAALVAIPIDDHLVSPWEKLDVWDASGPITDVAGLIETARDVDVRLANRLVEHFGGQEALVLRIGHEKPWVRDVRVSMDSEGRQIAEGVVRCVAPSVQTDVHGDVVELCSLLLSCVPNAEIAKCRAVDASGATVAYGDFVLADKQIPRRNLPGSAAVAWNRARLRAIAGSLGARSRTERLLFEQSLLERTAKALASAADYWCRGSRLPQAQIDELRRIVEDAKSLPPPPSEFGGEVGPLEEGELNTDDPVGSLAAQISRNLIPRLFDPNEHPPKVMAFIVDTLIAQYIEKLEDLDRWRLLSQPPINAIKSIHGDLNAIHAVISEGHVGGDESRKKLRRGARQGRTGNPLEKCSNLARRFGEQRLVGQIEAFRQRLLSRGYRADTCHRTPAKLPALIWPSDEVAVLIDVPSTLDWLLIQRELPTLRAGIFEELRTIVAAPLREGKVVASLGGSLGTQQFWSRPDVLLSWEEDLPYSVLREKAADVFGQCVEALGEVSAIQSGSEQGLLRAIEQRTLEAALSRFEMATDQLATLAQADSEGMINDAAQELTNWTRTVQDQLDAAKDGKDLPASFAIDLMRGLKGDENETATAVVLVRLALIEWDVNPVGAHERWKAGLNRLQ